MLFSDVTFFFEEKETFQEYSLNILKKLGIIEFILSTSIKVY